MPLGELNLKLMPSSAKLPNYRKFTIEVLDLINFLLMSVTGQRFNDWLRRTMFYLFTHFLRRIGFRLPRSYWILKSDYYNQVMFNVDLWVRQSCALQIYKLRNLDINRSCIKYDINFLYVTKGPVDWKDSINLETHN